MNKRSRISRGSTNAMNTATHIEEQGICNSHFVHPSRRLTPEQVKLLRASGIIPIEDEKGETTRYVPVRLDTETLKQLRILKLKLKKQKKKVTDSEVLRLVLLKGLEHIEEVEQSQKTK